VAFLSLLPFCPVLLKGYSLSIYRRRTTCEYKSRPGL
jgi:hypothetical protein